MNKLVTESEEQKSLPSMEMEVLKPNDSRNHRAPT